MLDVAKLAMIMPRCPVDKRELHCAALVSAMRAGEITTVTRAAAFLGQLALESGELRWMREVWNIGQVPNQVRYERDPKSAWPPTPQDARNKLAWRLGNSESGDGYLFRGWGPIQNTGRANTTKASQALFGDDRLVRHPEMLDDPEVGMQGARWYWQDRGLNALADALDYQGITVAINGGLTNYNERYVYTVKALGVLGRDVVVVG